MWERSGFSSCREVSPPPCILSKKNKVGKGRSSPCALATLERKGGRQENQPQEPPGPVVEVLLSHRGLVETLEGFEGKRYSRRGREGQSPPRIRSAPLPLTSPCVPFKWLL